MAVLDQLVGGGVAGLAKAFTSIADEWHLSPEKKQAFDLQIQQAKADEDQRYAALQVQLNQIASDNIKTETSSTDWFVRRARPAFLWIIALAIGLNLILPLLNHFFGGAMQPLIVDHEYYLLFRDAFLGYTIARTVEKAKDKD